LLRVVERQAYDNGLGVGVKRAANGAFLRGLLVGVLLAVAGIGACAAQAVPLQAETYRRELVRAAQSSWGMGAPVATLGAQVMVESAFRPRAVSWAGASGLAQMMPATAASLAKQYPALQPVNVFDPSWSLRAQAYLLRDLVRRYEPVGANACEAGCYAATAYNGGPKWTDRRIAMSPAPSRCIGVTRLLNPGVRASAQAENEQYPVRVLLDWEPRFVAAGWGAGMCENYSRRAR
jgi:soluble lytic murein transglycosylase-like protein